MTYSNPSSRFLFLGSCLLVLSPPPRSLSINISHTTYIMVIKLDKFGRRIQRMEDDGTVNMRKERRGNLEGVYDDDVDAPFGSPDNAGGVVAAQSPSLASFLGKHNDRGSGTTIHDAGLSDKARGGDIAYVDLKELLPKQKMKFLKLDVSNLLHVSLTIDLCRCMIGSII
jgi:hypothetical protein